MAVGVVNYPTSLDTADSLFRVVNGTVSTTINNAGGISAGDNLRHPPPQFPISPPPAPWAYSIPKVLYYEAISTLTLTGFTRGAKGPVPPVIVTAPPSRCASSPAITASCATP